MFSSYDEFIKREIDSLQSYDAFYTVAIRYIPAFFKLLTKIIEMNDISFESRVRINCALAYLVIENDVLPENIYGAEGYMDDLFVLVYVIKELLPKHSDVMKAHWKSITLGSFDDKELDVAINDCHAFSMNILSERRILDKTLEFAGLKKS